MPARISSRSLVERRAELEALEHALERAADGDPTVTLVIGEAGIGKSRLLREVELHARAQRHGGAARRVPAPRRRRPAVRPAGGAAARRRRRSGSTRRSASSARRCGRSSSARSRTWAPGSRSAAARSPTASRRRACSRRSCCCSARSGARAPLLRGARGRPLGRPLHARVRALPRARAAARAPRRRDQLPHRRAGQRRPRARDARRAAVPRPRGAGRARPARPRGRRRPARGDPRPRRPSRRWPPSCTSAAAATRCSPRSCSSAHRDPGGEKLPARLADALRVRLRRVPEPVRAAAALRGRDRPPGAAPRCSAPPPGTRRAGALGRAARRRRPPPARPRPRARRVRVPPRRRARGGLRRPAPGRARAGARRGRARRSATRARTPSSPCTGARRAIAAAGAARVGRGGAGGRGRRARSTRRCATCAPRSSCGTQEGDPGVGLDRVELLGHLSDLARHTGEHAQAVAWCEQALAAGSTRPATPRGRRASSSGSGACRRSRTTAAWPPTARRCGACPTSDRAEPARLLGAEAYALWALHRHDEARERGGGGARDRRGRRRGGRGRLRAHGARARGRLRRATPRRAPRTCGPRSPSSRASAARRTCSTRTSTSPSRCGCSATPRRRSRSPREGERHARRLGMQASFGRFLALNAATDEFLLGRWADAEARLAELDDRDLEPWNAIARGQVAGQLRAGARAASTRPSASCAMPRRCARARPPSTVPAVLRGPGRARALAGPRRRAPGRRSGAAWRRCDAVEQLLYAPDAVRDGGAGRGRGGARGRRGRRPARARRRGRRPAGRRARGAADGRRRARRRRSPMRRRRAPRRRGPRARTPRPCGRAVAGAWAAVGAPYPAAYAGWRRRGGGAARRGRPARARTRCAPPTSRRRRSAPS